MKQKTILAVAAMVLLATFTAVAYASYTEFDGIDGYVYGNGMPAEGIYVRVYNSLDQLEGYGVEPGPTQGLLGTDITDASGYFHIAWLYAHGGTYKVVAETPVEDLVEYVQVNCGSTTRLCFNFCYEEPGYTPGFWKHNIGVALGYNPGNYSAFRDGTKLTAEMLQDYAATVGVTLEEAYAAVSARGNREGQAEIRADMANAFNDAAGYGPFED